MKTGKLQQQALGSQIFLDTGNGYGSTNNKIRRFTNSTITGTVLTYADSAANGMTITASVACIVAVTYIEGNATGRFGISKKSNELTTAVQSIAGDTRYGNQQVYSADFATVSATIVCAAGDVIRAHTDGAAQATSAQNTFRAIVIALL
jgi:hypothetical protein